MKANKIFAMLYSKRWDFEDLLKAEGFRLATEKETLRLLETAIALDNFFKSRGFSQKREVGRYMTSSGIVYELSEDQEINRVKASDSDEIFLFGIKI